MTDSGGEVAADAASPGDDAEVWPRDAESLIAYLRENGFKVGVSEALRAIGLLLRLSESGSPKSVEEAALWLSPVLCTTPRQQTILPEYLRAFDRRMKEERRERAPRRSSKRSETSTTIVRPLALPRFLRWTISLLAVAMLVGFAGSRIGVFANLGRDTRSVAQSPPMSPEKPVSPKSYSVNVSTLAPKGVASLGLPLLAWLLIVRWRRSNRPTVSRGLFDGRPAVSFFPRNVSTFDPFSISLRGLDDPRERVQAEENHRHALRLALQSMRTHRLVPSRAIDARASIRATTGAAGAPRFVRGRRLRLPEYPLLVERRAARDHLPLLGGSLAAHLDIEEVPHSLYVFDGDPRYLRTDDQLSTPMSLAELASRHDEDILVILSDGECLLDPFLGHLLPWTNELQNWHVVVLLTPVPRHRWTWRERRLTSGGLVVLPATHEGLVTFGAFIRAQSRPPRLAFERPAARPSPIASEGNRALQWHTDVTPSGDECDRVVEAISMELSRRAFELTCVLALFPELRPDLTLHMAASLRDKTDGPLIGGPDFAAMAALPWFRVGRMPNWLRLTLARMLSESRAAEARTLYSEWLASDSEENAVDDSDPVSITKAGDAAADDRGLRPDGAAQDALFLRFMNQEELDTLDLQIASSVAEKVDRKQALLRRSMMFVSLSVLWLLMVVLAWQGWDAAALIFVVNQIPVVLVLMVTGLGLCSIGVAVGQWRAFRGGGKISRYGIAPFVCTALALILAPLQIEEKNLALTATLYILPIALMCLVPPRPETVRSLASFGIASNGIIVGITLIAAGLTLEASLSEVLSAIGLVACAAGTALLYAQQTRHAFIDVFAGAASVLFIAVFGTFALTEQAHSTWVFGLVAPQTGSVVAIASYGKKQWAPIILATSCFVLLFIASALPEFTGPVGVGITSAILLVMSLLLPHLLTHHRVPRDVATWVVVVSLFAIGVTVAVLLQRALVALTPTQADVLGLIPTDRTSWTLLTSGAGVISSLFVLRPSRLWMLARLQSSSVALAALDSLRIFAPKISSLLVGGLWVACLSPGVNDPSKMISLAALALPLAVLLATRVRSGGLLLLLVGLGPFIVTYHRFWLDSNPGMALSCVVLFLLLTRPYAIEKLRGLASLRAYEIAAVLLILSAQITVALPSSGLELGGSPFQFCFWFMALLGLAGARVVRALQGFVLYLGIAIAGIYFSQDSHVIPAAFGVSIAPPFAALFAFLLCHLFASRPKLFERPVAGWRSAIQIGVPFFASFLVSAGDGMVTGVSYNDMSLSTFVVDDISLPNENLWTLAAMTLMVPDSVLRAFSGGVRALIVSFTIILVCAVCALLEIRSGLIPAIMHTSSTAIALLVGLLCGFWLSRWLQTRVGSRWLAMTRAGAQISKDTWHFDLGLMRKSFDAPRIGLIHWLVVGAGAVAIFGVAISFQGGRLGIILTYAYSCASFPIALGLMFVLRRLLPSYITFGADQSILSCFLSGSPWTFLVACVLYGAVLSASRLSVLEAGTRAETTLPVFAAILPSVTAALVSTTLLIVCERNAEIHHPKPWLSLIEALIIGSVSALVTLGLAALPSALLGNEWPFKRAPSQGYLMIQSGLIAIHAALGLFFGAYVPHAYRNSRRKPPTHDELKRTGFSGDLNS